MYPRLYLARNLLRDDGVIFISIDDNELSNLRKLSDEIFGEENFIANFIWEKRTNRENRKVVSLRHDFILCYCKDKASSPRILKQQPMTEKALLSYKNPDNDPRGLWKSDPATAQAGHGTKKQFYVLTAPNGKKHSLESGRCWLYTEDVMKKVIEEGKIWFGRDGNGVPRIKTFLDEKERGLTPETIWFADDVSTTENSKNQLKELFDEVSIFETPKPVDLLKLAIQISTDDDIVLDFFAGSATTAHAVLDLNNQEDSNRRFIMVQLPEPCDPDSEAFKSGYKTVADIGKERIRRVIKKLNNEDDGKLDLRDKASQDRGFKVLKLDRTNFKQWERLSPETPTDEVVKQMELMTDRVDHKATEDDLLYEVILKSGLSLTQPIEKRQIAGVTVHVLEDGLFMICLASTVSQELFDAVASAKPARFICLETAFKGNDKLKANASLTFKAMNTSKDRASQIVFEVI